MRMCFRWLMVLSCAVGALMESAAAASQELPSGEETNTMDCRGFSWECPALMIRGDSIDNSLFRGMADPSIRQDPASGRLWLAYSWPNMIASRTPGSQLHLAHSDDQGDTWTYDSTLFS